MDLPSRAIKAASRSAAVADTAAGVAHDMPRTRGIIPTAKCLEKGGPEDTRGVVGENAGASVRSVNAGSLFSSFAL
jgi:hypothetical protein